MQASSRLAKPFRLAGFLAAALLALAGNAALAGAGTVSCSAASKPAEFAICNSEDLQLLDGRVDELYKSRYSTAPSVSTQTALLRDHRNWLAERNECRADSRCLERHYKARLSKLETQEKSTRAPIAEFTRFAEQR
jgi:uncharacterized protein